MGFDTIMEVHVHAGTGYCEDCAAGATIVAAGVGRPNDTGPPSDQGLPPVDKEGLRREELRRLKRKHQVAQAAGETDAARSALYK